MICREEDMQSLQSSRTGFKFRLWNLLAVKPQANYLISLNLCLFVLKIKASNIQAFGRIKCKKYAWHIVEAQKTLIPSLAIYPAFLQLAEG